MRVDTSQTMNCSPIPTSPRIVRLADLVSQLLSGDDEDDCSESDERDEGETDGDFSDGYTLIRTPPRTDLPFRLCLGMAERRPEHHNAVDYATTSRKGRHVPYLDSIDEEGDQELVTIPPSAREVHELVEKLPTSYPCPNPIEETTTTLPSTGEVQNLVQNLPTSYPCPNPSAVDGAKQHNRLRFDTPHTSPIDGAEPQPTTTNEIEPEAENLAMLPSLMQLMCSYGEQSATTVVNTASTTPKVKKELPVLAAAA